MGICQHLMKKVRLSGTTIMDKNNETNVQTSKSPPTPSIQCWKCCRVSGDQSYQLHQLLIRRGGGMSTFDAVF